MSRFLREWLICLAVVLSCAAVLLYTDLLERVDLGIYDAVLRFDSRPANPDILIVAVDEASLQAIGRWPWPRERHAELMENLTKSRPRAVAMDMLFVEPSKDDNVLAASLKSLREHSQVFLPITLRDPLAPGRVPLPLLPVPELVEASTALGHIHVELDSDSVARSLYVREGSDELGFWDAISALLAQAAGAPSLPSGPDSSPKGTGWHRISRLLIPFASGSGAYRMVPYVSVLRGEVPEAYIRDKLVLVGLTATGVGDRYPTPVSSAGVLTPGVEINAAALDGFLSERMIRPIPLSVQSMVYAILLIGWMLCLWRLGPKGGAFGVACFTLLALTLTIGLQAVFHRWLPVVSCVATAWLAYLLWSWRRLAYLLSDLYRRAEALLPGTTRLVRRDGWQDVVELLDRGLIAEEQLKQQRSEALQLLSHDFRAPQVAILALLDTAEEQEISSVELNLRIEQQVRATLDLADDFVMLLRAEGEVYDWQDVDVAQLVVDVFDRAWPLAAAKRITLKMELPRFGEGNSVAECMFEIDSKMLSRAFFNLVDNAVKYSPANSTVWMSLQHKEDRSIDFSVRDEGKGISAEDLPYLFKRFKRFAESESVSGHGLGLCLVKAVADQHGGQVECRSELGVGSIFVLSLPGSRAQS